MRAGGDGPVVAVDSASASGSGGAGGAGGAGGSNSADQTLTITADLDFTIERTDDAGVDLKGAPVSNSSTFADDGVDNSAGTTHASNVSTRKQNAACHTS